VIDLYNQLFLQALNVQVYCVVPLFTNHKAVCMNFKTNQTLLIK